MRVLVVEDELKMASLLRRGLQEEGHAADVARTGDDALWMAAAVDYDVIVLDVMLPGLDGFEVCRRLRERGVWAPVLMLTARDAVEDRVDGPRCRRRRLPAEAVRVRRAARPPPRARPARARRAAGRARGRATCALDPSTHQVWRGETAIELSAEGVRAARDVHAPPGPGARPATSCSSTPGTIAYENHSNVVDVYVRYLREKVDRPFGVESLETVRGAGYRLRAEAS